MIWKRGADWQGGRGQLGAARWRLVSDMYGGGGRTGGCSVRGRGLAGSTVRGGGGLAAVLSSFPLLLRHCPPPLLPSPPMQVGAPSLPNLLGALDPFSGEPTTRRGGAAGLDPYKLLSSLAVGECSLPPSRGGAGHGASCFRNRTCSSFRLSPPHSTSACTELGCSEGPLHKPLPFHLGLTSAVIPFPPPQARSLSCNGGATCRGLPLPQSRASRHPFRPPVPLPPGTELELQWGRNLQAAVAHKLRDGSSSDVGTEATLTYRINSVMRVQLQLARLTKPSLLLQYSSDGMPAQ